MNFLFPLFLVTGIALAIPIIIHLFNFRKYKTIEFSDTRLLQQVKVTSQKSRKIQNIWLLLSRLLFLSALIIAFAQPYFGNKTTSSKSIQLIYIDNSQSMADNQGGQKSLLLNAIDEARNLIKNSNEDQQFILLNNNNIYASRPLVKTQIIEELNKLKISAKTISLQQINKAVVNAISDNNASNADVYFISDLQKSTLLRDSISDLKENVNYIFKHLVHKTSTNLYIDTAFFTNPVLDTRHENPLIVKLRKSNSNEQIATQVQVWVNDQMRAAKNVAFENDSVWMDTIPLMINASGWHKIAITVKDAPIQFDDTFRITAKTNANLSILNLSNGYNNSPYIQAAFSPLNGFMVKNELISSNLNDDWSKFNLIVLQNLNSITPDLSYKIKNGLENGLSFFLVPGNINDVVAFNQQLSNIAPISFGTLDTSHQQVGSLQTEHRLLRDVIASIPPNAQLPLVLKYYPLTASLNAGQQSVMTLKNGKPFLAQYSVGNGFLYIVTSSLDEASTNFALSNLFMPILYKMSAVSGAQSIYAINANSNVPVFIPNISKNRMVFKAIDSKGFETIPNQNAYGNGTNLYLGKTINEAGFYTIKNENSSDSLLVAVNSNLLESELKPITDSDLKQALKPSTVKVKSDNELLVNNQTDATNVWKWFAAIALFALIVETYFLLRKPKPSKALA